MTKDKSRRTTNHLDVFFRQHWRRWSLRMVSIASQRTRRWWSSRRFFIFISNQSFLDASFFSADLISTIEFNEDGELLAVGDKGGRIVVFQREPLVKQWWKEPNLNSTCFSFAFVLVEHIATSKWIQCLYYFSFSWTRIRLFKKFGNRRKNQSDTLVKTKKSSAFPPFHQW